MVLSDDDRERITSCTDPTTLDDWIDRAVDATSIKEILG